MHSATTTFVCDLCESSKTVKGEELPDDWRIVSSKDKEICPECVESFMYSITLEEAKQLVESKTPVNPPQHPFECRCQACVPD